MKRLTPAQFRGLIDARGYTMAETAKLFGVSAARITQVAADEGRARHYDLALWALAPKRSAAAIDARRARTLARISPIEGATKKHRQKFLENEIWAMNTEPGNIFVVHAAQGDHLPEGCEGIIRRVSRIHGEQMVEIEFSTGYTEAFALSYLKGRDCFLSPTGKQLR
jgi:hypothetical protein